MKDEQIKHMVERFLSWKLPENFHPDGGISFEPEFNVEYNAKHGLPPQRCEPIGTNLFDYTQAEAMVRYMLDGLPETPPPDVMEVWRIEWGGGMPERDRQTILAGEWDATTGMQVLARHAQAARAEGYEQAIRDAAEWLRGPSVPDHSDEGGCPFDKAAVAILKLLENRE